MIRKLRIKIVLVIVLVAAVMLGVIFGMSYTMTRQDLRAQSLSMMQAIAADHRSIDGTRCLSCFRCIRSCPVGAKHMDVESYLDFARDFSRRLKARRENEYIF